MRIRTEQIVAFRHDLERNYERRVIELLIESFPEAAILERAELQRDVHEQVMNARSYGLLTEVEMSTYVVTAWMLGKTFDGDFLAARETLKAPNLSAEAKEDWLANWTDSIFFTLEGA